MTTTRDDVIISAHDLRARLAAGDKIVLLDVRYVPQQPSQRPEYEAGHIPGAHFVELATQLAGARAEHSGNNPLPSPIELERSLRSWGIDDDSLVVVYANREHAAAARAWFVLSWAGVPVRYLDGGLPAWIVAGGELSTSEAQPGDGTVTVTPDARPTLTADEAGEIASTGLLLDARGGKQYEAGHIPGAVSAPTGDSLDENGLLKPEAQLRAQFAGVGVADATSIGTYCGGGVAASHQALVLATLGITAPVFIGSWSAWSSDSSRPVATGAGER